MPAFHESFLDKALEQNLFDNRPVKIKPFGSIRLPHDSDLSVFDCPEEPAIKDSWLQAKKKLMQPLVDEILNGVWPFIKLLTPAESASPEHRDFVMAWRAWTSPDDMRVLIDMLLERGTLSDERTLATANRSKTRFANERERDLYWLETMVREWILKQLEVKGDLRIVLLPRMSPNKKIHYIVSNPSYASTLPVQGRYTQPQLLVSPASEVLLTSLTERGA
jgi:hypothetical protein